MNWSAFLSGYGGPILATLFGIAGVFLGRFIATSVRREGEEKLSWRTNAAIITLFSLAVIGYVRENLLISPLRMLGYGWGAGFLGLGLLEFLASQFQERFKAAWGAFMSPEAKDQQGISNAMTKLNNIPDMEEPDGPRE